MQKSKPVSKHGRTRLDGYARWPWFVGLGCLLAVLVGLLLPHSNRRAADREISAGPEGPTISKGPLKRRSLDSTGVPAPTPEEVVATKVMQFARSRRSIYRAMAKRNGVQVSPEAEQFFDAAQAGRWEELRGRYESLSQRRRGEDPPADLKVCSAALNETFGVAEVAHNWPAQKLLDYGNAVLDSLRPGMVYVGGTDAGRYIPTLLNETSEGEHHVILTQNALADRAYLDYASFLYGDRVATPGGTESDRAFQDYIAGAQRRLLHDQENPDEASQLLPGEDVRMIDNRLQVSGQVAVMAINERLLQMFMDNNPGASVALEESFPFRSTYSNAVPLGPIMELGVSDVANTFTAERVSQSLDFWCQLAQELAGDPEAPDGSDPRKTYARMAAAQANLFSDHQYSGQAEQAFALATQICPSSPEAVFGYANLLVSQNRVAEAIPVVQAAVNAAPGYQQFNVLLGSLQAKLAGNRSGG
jgi:hypothetical protein